MTIAQKINATTTIKIAPLKSETSVTGPFYAINFFNTKVAWLYGFYNFLAARPARKAGAKAFIKIRQQKTLAGRPEDGREFLLLVHYARAQDFLDLMSDRVFQIFSILRILSVKDFSFVFSKRVDGPASKTQTPISEGKKKTYALHHFSSEKSLEKNLVKIRSLAKGAKASVYFASTSAAKIIVEEEGKPPRELPFITSNLVLFEADTAEDLESFLLAKAYRAFTATVDQSYIGLYSRIL